MTKKEIEQITLMGYECTECKELYWTQFISKVCECPKPICNGKLRLDGYYDFKKA